MFTTHRSFLTLFIQFLHTEFSPIGGPQSNKNKLKKTRKYFSSTRKKRIFTSVCDFVSNNQIVKSRNLRNFLSVSAVLFVFVWAESLTKKKVFSSCALSTKIYSWRSSKNRISFQLKIRKNWSENRVRIRTKRKVLCFNFQLAIILCMIMMWYEINSCLVVK